MKSMIKAAAILTTTVSFASLAAADGHLSLDGKTIGVAVVGTQHFWDREAFNGAVSTVEELGATIRFTQTTTMSC
jgi:ribose transport system substrate-binding protein